MSEFGTLYLVPTPIGNLDDFSKRGIETLKSADYIACEDTRKTSFLCKHFSISAPLISYYKEKEEKSSEKIVELLKNGKNIALVSDAGSPLISDPGNILVKKCINLGIHIVSIPGPCAAISALIASGFDLSNFNFFGFLQKEKEDLLRIKFYESPTIVYEAPHRIINTLKLIDEIMPERNLCIAKEISKINEKYFYGTASKLLEIGLLEKGEFIIIIDKFENKNLDISEFVSLNDHLMYYLKKGFSKKDSIKQVAKDLNLPKNEVYKKFIE